MISYLMHDKATATTFYIMNDKYLIKGNLIIKCYMTERWKTLQHNGVLLPPPYEPKGLSIKIKGEVIKLTPEQEEMAYAFAKKKDTPYVKDRVFVSNFLYDFLKLFPKEYRSASIEDIDFSEVYLYVDREKEIKNSMDKESRKRLASERKMLRQLYKEKYGYAIVDGVRCEIANWVVEPPGIFMGRGEHPLRGRWKPRVYANDIIINIGEDAPVPENDWKAVVHDHESTWLAKWDDKLTGKEKYVWLSDSAKIRQENDKTKYDSAMKLAKQIDRILAMIEKGMKENGKDDNAEKKRKIATVCYLIYRLAMRVGDEKDTDEADTVGATTLRVEHIRLSNGNRMDFDFLGKDSVRWQKSIEVNDSMDEVAYRNLEEFISGKKEGEEIFSGITSRHVNRFLNSIADGLTAKVFRTYLATNVVNDYLSSLDESISNEPEYVKVYHARMANLMAAVTCNHKRAIPKNFESTMEKKRSRLDELNSVRNELRDRLKSIGMGISADDKKSVKEAERLSKRIAKLDERIDKLRLEIRLKQECMEYNLVTSLRNYIDPRAFYTWCKHVGLDWSKVYTSSLQRKFLWVKETRMRWESIVRAYSNGSSKDKSN
jgi:DNA topoisomerase-1